MTASQLAQLIDHTLLKPETTPEQIDRLCDEAAEYGFGAVCVNPVYVRRAVARLDKIGAERADGRRTRVVSVAGFPLGANATVIKMEEARRALGDGATEIDMVIALGALMAGDHRGVREDIETVAHVVHEVPNRILKVILETAALTKDRIVLGCRCCAEGEADFVKTSTGFHPSGGATIEHVRLLVHLASPILVKAAGGIRTRADAVAFIEAGAARLGTSSGPAIIKELCTGGSGA